MLKIETLEEEIPVYDITVENNHNFYGNDILVHNCTEIVQPSRASVPINEELIIKGDDDRYIVKDYKAGEIALCNLASVNLLAFGKLSQKKKRDLIYDLVSTMDNTIDLADYPVMEGMNSNLQYRYLGIGVNNYANYLADKKIVIDTQEAKEETAKLFDELSYLILSTSNQLAMERGAFPKFYETEWAKGKVPLDMANKNALNLTKYKPDQKKWNILRDSIKTFGMRNALTMAVAPTATSGKAINATESTEPVQHFFYKEDGTGNIPTLVPNFKTNNRYYKKAFDCDQDILLELAAIRQIYIDQAQSINIYVKKPESLLELTKMHFKGFDLGIKTLYYFKQKKGEDELECESCT